MKKIKKNFVYNSDCLEVMRGMSSGTVDHCITDPPYNISGYDDKRKIGWLSSNPLWTETKSFKKIDEKWDKFGDISYAEFTKEWISEIKRVVKPNGNILIFGSYHNIYRVGVICEELDLKINNSIIWYKRNAFPNITGRMLCESTEQIVWAVNGSKKKAKNWIFNNKVLKGLTHNGKQMRNMWDIPMTPNSEKTQGKHPSQKPLELGDRLIAGFTKPGDLVIDPFAGSGSFLVSAKRLGRNYIGVEQDSKFVELANRRLLEI